MLEQVQDNIAKLISKYEEQKQRADALAAQLAKSEADRLRCQEQITDLNHRIDYLRMIIAFAGREPAEAKAGIDKLIGEIDKCIKLLEN